MPTPKYTNKIESQTIHEKILLILLIDKFKITKLVSFLGTTLTEKSDFLEQKDPSARGPQGHALW